MLENLALRRELTVLRRSVPRAKLQSADGFLWVLLLHCWCEEKDGKTVVTSHLVGNFPGSPVDLRFFFTLEGGKIS